MLQCRTIANNILPEEKGCRLMPVIIETFGGPGTEWLGEVGLLVRSKGTSLHVSNQLLHACLCARLMPVTRVLNVTKDRAQPQVVLECL